MARQPTTKKKTPVVPSELGVKQSSVYDYDYCMFDINKDLKFPYSIQTYKEMRKNINIASALNAVQIIALRVPRFIDPYNETDTHKKRADFVNECLGITQDNNDMTHSFDDFLREALSMNTYGFSIHEKVYRYRLNKFGSKYDDGKVGIKRLPIRPQDSIECFNYDEEGRELESITQKQSVPRTNFLKKFNLSKDGLIDIPRSRVLLFKADCDDGKGEGVSPLSYAYDTWRDLLRYEDLEGIAASKNLNGLPVIWMPSEYMIDDPDDEASKVYNTLKDGVSKIAIGQQSSLMLPSDREDLTGQGGKLFDFTLMSASSSNITAITAIIAEKRKTLLQCLFAAEIASIENVDSTKTSLLNMVVENRIKEIFTVINNDLIPELFELNGWDKTKTPKLRYGKLREIPFADFAKAMQQIKATKLVAVTPENINYIAEQMGLPYRVPLDSTKEELDKILGVEEQDSSKSGQGYSSDTGGLNGTGNSVSQTDNSANNLANK